MCFVWSAVLDAVGGTQTQSLACALAELTGPQAGRQELKQIV